MAVRLLGAATAPPPPPPVSLSWMFSVALAWAASRAAPPVGLDSARRTVSVGSTTVSLITGTVNVLLASSWSAQERVPERR